jgi:hypothetical protein
LLQQLVDQSGLAVIDVGDYRDIAKLSDIRHWQGYANLEWWSRVLVNQVADYSDHEPQLIWHTAIHAKNTPVLNAVLRGDCDSFRLQREQRIC